MKHFPFLILVVFLAKSLILPANLFDGCVILSMAALAYARYKQDHLEAIAATNWDEAVKDFEKSLDTLKQSQAQELAKIEAKLKRAEDRITALDFLSGAKKLRQPEVTKAAGINWFE